MFWGLEFAMGEVPKEGFSCFLKYPNYAPIIRTEFGGVPIISSEML
jgi:hypothetical protein